MTPALGKVLSVQSHVVSGFVGNKCAVLALTRLQFLVDAINTCQLSNHTGYPTVAGQRLGGNEVRDLWDGMRRNGLDKYTHVLSGYIGDETIVEELATIVSALPARQEFVADPVFGDDGHFYVKDTIPQLFERLLLPLATVITPNQFEAEVLTGVQISTLEDAARACRILFDKGPLLKTVVITSCSLSAEHVTLVASAREFAEDRVLVLPVKKLDGYSYTGTGDLLAALLLGWLTRFPGRNEADLSKAVDHAVAGLQVVLRDTHAHGEASREKARRELRLVENQDALLRPPEALLKELASTWVSIQHTYDTSVTSTQ